MKIVRPPHHETKGPERLLDPGSLAGRDGTGSPVVVAQVVERSSGSLIADLADAQAGL